MITAGAEHLPEPLRAAVGDALTFDDAVSAIRRYSLLDTDSEANLSLHRLVQAVIRDRLDEPGRQQWAEAAVNAVNKAFPNDSDDVRTWKECNRLLPHAIATTDLAEPLAISLEAAARLLNQNRQGTPLDARNTLMQEPLSSARSRSMKRPSVPIIRSWRQASTISASCCRNWAICPARKPLTSARFKIFQKLLGDDHPNTRLVRANIDSLSP